MPNIRRVAAALAACCALAPAWAGTITITTSDAQIDPGVDNQGWWSDLVSNNNAVNDNYITGVSGQSTFRSFFSFDLRGMSGTVTSATLHLQRYEQDGAVRLGFWDVSTPVWQLVGTRHSGFDLSIFEDLGGGASYGSYRVRPGAIEDVLSFTLNGAALADINRLLGSGYFSIGSAASGGYIFANSSDEPGNSQGAFNGLQALVLEVTPVPEPATWALWSAAAALYAGQRRRARRRTCA